MSPPASINSPAANCGALGESPTIGCESCGGRGATALPFCGANRAAVAGRAPYHFVGRIVRRSRGDRPTILWGESRRRVGDNAGCVMKEAVGSYRRGSQLCGLILRVVKENGYDKLRHSQLSSCAYGIIRGYGKI